MSKMVLKIYCAKWKNASRDKRELSVCRELGANVLVMFKGDNSDSFKKDIVDGFDVVRFSTRPLGEKLPKIVNKGISFLQCIYYVKKINPDIITGHDLPALFIAWASNIIRKRKAALVYDSHEFELGRNVQRSWIKGQMIRWCEHFLIKRCAFSIMVNDPIADEVQKEYRLEKRPIVVRNIPNLWTVYKDVCKKRRKELLNQMKNPQDMVLMYHGGLMKDRGIETLIKIVSANPEICAVVLGNGAAEYQKELQDLTLEFHVMDRVFFHSAVPLEKLWEYVGAADVGMILAPATCKNHYYSLPNKFFENIQSETPVICPDYPAMSPIVSQYHIGLTCDPTDLESVNQCVEKMRTDKGFYQKCKENLKIAKKELCWENEKQQLMAAYQEIL